MTIRHFVRFNVASFAGILLQLATLWLLTSRAGVHYQAATLLAVAAAIAPQLRVALALDVGRSRADARAPRTPSVGSR